jgi:zinc finger protein ZPR1
MTQDMPFFGPTLHTVVDCPACGFKHASSMVLQQHPPAKHTLRFRAPTDLGVRVVRSDSCTYSIPELGFRAEPAEASEAFVSNVQGVLERVRDVLLRARLLVEERERKARAEELLAQLQRILDGNEDATLVLEDPFGNSGIHSARAQNQRLTEAEAAALRSGRVMVDAEDL